MKRLDHYGEQKNSTEYCDKKGRAFVEEKLQKEFGWVCINQINN